MRYLRDLAFAAAHGADRAREFNRSTQCVTSAYLRALGTLRTDGTKKIYVEAFSDPTELERCAPGTSAVSAALGVTQVSVLFDYGAYWAATKQQRKRIVLERLHEAMLLAGEATGLDVAPFERAYRALLANGIANERLWGRPKLNRQRTRRASIWYEFDSDKIEVFAVAFDPSGNRRTAKRKLFECPPDDWYLYDALGKSRWVDEHTFELVARSGPNHVTPLAGKTWRARFPKSSPA